MLALDGELCIVGPDCDRAATFNDPDLMRGVLNGGCRWPGDRHYWRSTETATLNYVLDIFPDAAAVPVTSLPSSWPVVSRIDWQFAILA